MSLLRILVAAAVTLTASPVVRPVVRGVVIVAPANVVAPAATQALAEGDEVQARVEIGPAVLRLFDESGNVVFVE